MSEENVEIVRRGYDAYERGDRDGMVADFAPHFEYIAAGGVPGRTGTYAGPEGYKEFISWLDEEFTNAHSELEDLIEAGDSVAARVTLRGQGRRSGIPGSFTFWQVWTIDDGKIVRGQGFYDKAEALEAAGVSE